MHRRLLAKCPANMHFHSSEFPEDRICFSCQNEQKRCLVAVGDEALDDPDEMRSTVESRQFRKPGRQ